MKSKKKKVLFSLFVTKAFNFLPNFPDQNTTGLTGTLVRFRWELLLPLRISFLNTNNKKIKFLLKIFYKYLKIYLREIIELWSNID